MYLSKRAYFQCFLFVSVALTFYVVSRHRALSDHKLPSKHFVSKSETVYLRMDCVGRLNARLGNQMFMYASAKGIADQQKRSVKLCLDDCSLLKSAFVGPFPEECPKLSYAIVSESGFATFMGFPQIEGHAQVGMYLQSWKYFHYQEASIRKTFTFLPNVITKAKKWLAKNALVKKTLRKTYLVGIHARRSDQIGSPHFNFPPSEYFQVSLNYFHGAVFVLCTDDKLWAKDFISHQKAHKIILSENNTPPVDLAILSMCSTVVTTIGTFGWWAGWLAGSMAYNENEANVGDKLITKQFVPNDYYPPMAFSIRNRKLACPPDYKTNSARLRFLNCGVGRSDAAHFCPNDFAISILTSDSTCKRVNALEDTWLGRLKYLNVSHTIFSSGLQRMKNAVTVKVKDVKHNQITDLSYASMKKLRLKFPNKRWYMKVDDDAYLFFDNLLLQMAIQRVEANGAVAVGNMLWGHHLSGGAGYLLTGLAVDLGLEAIRNNTNNCNVPSIGEDTMWVRCLKEVGTKFVHLHGMSISEPHEVNSAWAESHPSGASLYPVTYHWVKTYANMIKIHVCHTKVIVPWPRQRPDYKPRLLEVEKTYSLSRRNVYDLQISSFAWKRYLPNRNESDWCPGFDESIASDFVRYLYQDVQWYLQGKCRKLVRVGDNGDGGKNVCVDDLPSECIVYSIGSRLEFSFEIDIYRKFGCKIHTFDCTVSPPMASNLPNNTKFYPWCVGGSIANKSIHSDVGYNKAKGQFYPLEWIMNTLGHKIVHIMKMDIERHEFNVFETIHKDIAPQQILVETHLHNAYGMWGRPVEYGTWQRMWKRLKSLSYTAVSMEQNLIGCKGCCAEWTLVRRPGHIPPKIQHTEFDHPRGAFPATRDSSATTKSYAIDQNEN